MSEFLVLAPNWRSSAPIVHFILEEVEKSIFRDFLDGAAPFFCAESSTLGRFSLEDSWMSDFYQAIIKAFRPREISIKHKSSNTAKKKYENP